MKGLKRDALGYGVLILGVLLLRSALTLFPVAHPQARQSLIQWKEILLLAAMGTSDLGDGACFFAQLIF